MHLLWRNSRWLASAVLAVSVAALTGGPGTAAADPAVCIVAGQAPAAPATAQAQGPAGSFSAEPGQAYLHSSTGANTQCNWSDLENAALNNHPGARILATSNINPYGYEASGYDHPLGVFFNTATFRWSVYNDDLASMNLGRAWNVFIPPQDTRLSLQDTTAGNSSGALTRIDDPQLFNTPQALIFVQHVYNPGGAASAGQGPQGAPSNYFTQTVGVTYDSPNHKWAIRTEDGSTFPYSKTFWVLKTSNTDTAFTHTVTAGSHLYSDSTALDRPELNGNPDAQILITQNLDGGVANNHRVGVSYDDVSHRWLILNLDHGNLALGARFNVLVIPPKTGYFVHTATLGNSSGNLTTLDNPDLNDNPDALVYVTHTWNPPESDNHIYNDHPLGVSYASGAWHVENVDGAPMPVGITLNVYYTWPRSNSFTSSASTTNTSGGHTTRLNNAQLNDNPNAVAILTYNHTPAGLPGGLYTGTVGLKYDGPTQAWDIFNLTGFSFSLTQTYNVLIPSPATRFVVTATTIAGDGFFFDTPLTNNNPYALIFVSARDHAGINPAYVGVYYDATPGRWAIYKENKAAMPVGVVYDIFVTRLRTYLPAVVK